MRKILAIGFLTFALSSTSCQDEEAVGNPPSNFDKIEGMWSGSFYSQDSVYKEINVVMVVDTVENSAARFVNTYQSKIICGKIDKSFTTGVLPFKKFFNNEFSFSMAYEDSTNLQLQNSYKGKFFSSTQCSLTVKTPFNSIGNNGEIVTVLTHQ